jgi:hypothetical protein
VSATDPADRGRNPQPPESEMTSADDSGESSLPRAIGTWPRAYALVLAVLAADILLFWLLSAYYSGGPA